jgi:hypothetical protein
MRAKIRGHQRASGQTPDKEGLAPLRPQQWQRPFDHPIVLPHGGDRTLESRMPGRPPTRLGLNEYQTRSVANRVQDLETICRSDRDIDNDFCVVIIGVVVNLMFQNNTCGHSPTDGATRQAFLNWADKHPEEWNTETLIGISRAMKATWPCPPE